MLKFSLITGELHKLSQVVLETVTGSVILQFGCLVISFERSVLSKSNKKADEVVTMMRLQKQLKDRKRKRRGCKATEGHSVAGRRRVIVH